MVELSSVYDQFKHSVEWWSEAQGFKKREFTEDQLACANTKSRIRMITLYQIAGAKGGIVVGTGNKVEDYGIGFYTKYGDGGVDIAPIADLYKTEVWLLGELLEVDERICDAPPTDGLWVDRRTDEEQIGATYAQLEEAMENGTGPAVEVLEKFNAKNKHKMQPIPTFKLRN
jgi:NAD+ synthase